MTAKYCVGVDIGGTTVKIGIFDREGTIISKWEIPSRTENGGDMVLPDIAESVLAKLDELSVAKSEVSGVGIGVPAGVREGGIVEATANLGWGYREVKREAEELLGIPVEVENDANVAALGEMWKGGGKGSKNMVMLTLGTGVGGGIIIDGKIFRGATGSSGEIGHMTVNYEETDKCGCGKTGCLEQYASATGVVRLAKAHLAEYRGDTVLKSGDVTAKDVFDAVKAGDQAAMEIAEKFGEYLGYALANLAAILDPKIFVIGGGVSKAGPILLDYIRKYYLKKICFSFDNIKFALAELGNDAGICGAAKLVM